MQIIHVKTNTKREIVIESVENKDYKTITKIRYWFNWKTEKENIVYKLRLADNEDILGLISLVHFKEEERFEISLLAVAKENRGKNKTYEGIAGNLIAFACREAIKLHGINGCVSLIPKDTLRDHYIRKYKMLRAGKQIYLEGNNLLNLLTKYKA